MPTETKTQAATQEVDEILREGLFSIEQDDVSGDASGDEIKDELEEEDVEEPEDKAEDKTADAKSGKPDPAFEARVKSEADKRTNSFRERREVDAALIRSLSAQVKELRVTGADSKLSKAMAAVLEGDEEEGIGPDKLEARKKGLDEVRQSIREYNQNAAGVEETAQVIELMAKELKLDKDLADKYFLDDSNPHIRAKGGAQLITHAISAIQREKALFKILEEIPILRNGSEVRAQIESFINDYMELSDEKGRDLLLSKLKRDLSVTPRKSPKIPADSMGGMDLSKFSGEELLRQAVAEDKNLHK